MGKLDEMLSMATGSKPEYKEGYSPVKCWNGSGYITIEMRNKVRDAIKGSHEMSDEDIVFLIEFFKFYDGFEGDVQSVIVDGVTRTFQHMMNHRGEASDYNDVLTLRIILGWNDWCLMQSIIASGERAKICMSSYGKNDKAAFWVEKA